MDNKKSEKLWIPISYTPKRQKIRRQSQMQQVLVIRPFQSYPTKFGPNGVDGTNFKKFME